MSERLVTITVRLPEPEAELAELLERVDPSFFRRLVQYGLLRRQIYRHLGGNHLPAADSQLAAALNPSTESGSS